ncbi:MAG TPA: pirin family protein [Acidimicrobiales bacterium]
MTTVDIRRAHERLHTKIDWLDSWHCFSFGHHYDPTNTHHGLLLVLNDDRVAPGGGFPPHSHRDMEIVTWVLDGQLEHRDSEGNHGVIEPGLAQRMSAGTGIRHSEMNASTTEPVHFLQMWVPPDTNGLPPSYEQRSVADELARGDLFVLASGRGDGAIHINQRGAALLVGRLPAQKEAEVPDAPHVHVFIARGSAELEDAGTLDAGDAARLTDAGARRLTAGADGAEVVVWATD